MSLEGDASPNGGQESGRLTIDELIRVGINGKSAAVARYDAILWRVRSGFVFVIYGAITLVSTILGKGDTGVLDHVWVAPVTVLAFSLAAVVIDSSFSRSKYRVVASRNALVRLSWRLARSRFADAALEENEDRLLTLLEMSGERQDSRTLSEVRRYLRSPQSVLVFVSLYVTPIVLAVALAIVAHQ